MLGTGPLIAVYVVCLYVFLAPVVLFGIFVLFDILGGTSPEGGNTKSFQTPGEKDPAVWTAQDIAAFWEHA